MSLLTMWAAQGYNFFWIVFRALVFGSIFDLDNKGLAVVRCRLVTSEGWFCRRISVKRKNVANVSSDCHIRILLSFLPLKNPKKIQAETQRHGFRPSKKLMTGIEPVTSALPRRRSTDWATSANCFSSPGIIISYEKEKCKHFFKKIKLEKNYKCIRILGAFSRSGN